MIATELFTITLINIILSGDVGQARLWADAHPELTAMMGVGQRSRVAYACQKWGIPGIVPIRA